MADAHHNKNATTIMSTTITLKDDYKLVCESFTIHNDNIKLSIDSKNIVLNKIVYISRLLRSNLLIEGKTYILSIDIQIIKMIVI